MLHIIVAYVVPYININFRMVVVLPLATICKIAQLREREREESKTESTIRQIPSKLHEKRKNWASSTTLLLARKDTTFFVRRQIGVCLKGRYIFCAIVYVKIPMM